MRSTEASGIGVLGVDEKSSDAPTLNRSGTISRLLDRLPSMPRSTLILVTLLAASLFIVTDIVRTLGDAQARLRSTASGLAAQLISAPSDEVAMVLLRSARLVGDDIIATLRDPLGQVVATTRAVELDDMRSSDVGEPEFAMLVQDVPMGALGTLDLRLPQDEALEPVWWRSAAAAGLALFVCLIGLRPAPARRRAAQPDRVSDLIGTIPFGVAQWTAQGRLVVSNAEFRRRLALQPAEVAPGASYQDAVKSLVLGGFVRLVGENDHSRMLEVHREDGSCLVIDERPLKSGGFVTLVSDVTEGKRKDTLLTSIREEQRQLARRYHEEKLKAEAASRSKTSFLAHISHDVRTPLNHIIGFAELLRHQAYGPLGDERYATYATTIKEAGEGLLASFATILDLAEFESGQKTLKSETFAVDDLVNTVLDRFRPQALRAGLRMQAKGPCGANVVADRFCLERMLGNIVENAIRFTPAGGKVTLGAFAANDGVVLEITDTGIGMSEEKLATLSQPFVLGDATFTKGSSGDAGLGIAIARAIAELSGGHLAIDSSPALGTTVAISLPLRTAEEAVAA